MLLQLQCRKVANRTGFGRQNNFHLICLDLKSVCKEPDRKNQKKKEKKEIDQLHKVYFL